jgi:hypothetical protein
MIAHAWQILVVALVGWLNRQQQDVVEYLQEENRVLRKHLKGKRIRFTDDQPRRLASKGKGKGIKPWTCVPGCIAGEGGGSVGAIPTRNLRVKRRFPKARQIS